MCLKKQHQSTAVTVSLSAVAIEISCTMATWVCPGDRLGATVSDSASCFRFWPSSLYGCNNTAAAAGGTVQGYAQAHWQPLCLLSYMLGQVPSWKRNICAGRLRLCQHHRAAADQQQQPLATGAVVSQKQLSCVQEKDSRQCVNIQSFRQPISNSCSPSRQAACTAVADRHRIGRRESRGGARNW
jgi:hypothetical protein